MLVSRKHPIRYYGVLFITSAFLVAFPVGCLWVMYLLYETDSRMAIFLGALCLLFGFPALIFGAVHTYKGYVKNASSIRMNASEISFGDTAYPLSEIQFICLTGKPPFGEYQTAFNEGATIKFYSGDIQYISDEIYVNAWEFKLALEQVINKNRASQIAKIEQKKASEVATEESQQFAGSQWSSFNGIMLWGVVGFFTFLGIFLGGEAVWLFVLSFNIFWYLFWGNQMNYFVITEDNHLIIRNHVFPFRKYAIRLSDIREVTFEMLYRKPISLRIITKDFRSKIFPASTLRNRHWFDLKIALEEHGIFVRNECVEDFDWDLETIERTNF